MELITAFTLYVIVFAFLSGLLITAITGSARPIKYYLAFLTVLFILASIPGFFYSSGWLIFLYTQLIVVLLIVFGVIITGAIAGGGIYLLIHRKATGRNLAAADIPDYLPLEEFAATEGITKERAFARIKSGYYQGGKFEGDWYIHASELS